MKNQPTLFPLAQKRSGHVENVGLYANIAFLRSRGYRVIRAGPRNHKVDGRVCSAHQLRAIAEIERRKTP